MLDNDLTFSYTNTMIKQLKQHGLLDRDFITTLVGLFTLIHIRRNHMKLSKLVNEVNAEQDLYKKVDELCKD